MTPEQIVKQLVELRNIDDIEVFFNPEYGKLHDPLLLPDIDKAVDRIKKAKSDKQTVGIYGDYDIDGLSATALLSDAFKSFGINTIGFIPDRFVDGYGMSKRGIDELKKKGVELIITVDCGSKSEAEIAYAKSLGIDTIVTDHHEISEVPKTAVAVINTKRADSKYPFAERSGAGVAFGLVQALQKNDLGGLEPGQEKWLLDLVALSTVADMVPLIDENRILLKWGLEVLKQTRRPGLQALIQTASLQADEIDETKIGFRLGPRMNAAGRIEHGKLTLELLMTDDFQKATTLAHKLEAFNQQRREEQDRIMLEASKLVAKRKDDPVLVISGQGWSEGVVGIVASKIMELFEKPTFILAEDEQIAKGSARSFGNFNLAEAIDNNKDLLIKGGGHSAAAGITIKKDKIDQFRKKIIAEYSALKLVDQKRFLRSYPELTLDDLSAVNLELTSLLQQMAPFGQANPQPVFQFNNLKALNAKAVGTDKTHLKLDFIDRLKNQVSAIAFSQADSLQQLNLEEEITVIGRVSENSFNGNTSAQIEVLSIQQA